MHECIGQWGPSFGPDGFSEKVLTADYRGLSVQKRCVFFYFFGHFSKEALKDFANFYTIVVDNMSHRLFEQNGLSEKVLNPGV